MSLRRYQERPSLAHVITTCFGLMYLLMFMPGFYSLLPNPQIDHDFPFWTAFTAISVVLVLAALFLIRELFRQALLFRRWKRQ